MNGQSTDYHTHSRFCDGSGALKDYAVAAVEKGLSALGFSAHAPVPFESEWHMKAASVPEYLAEARHTRTAYAGALSVYIGLEVDYVPGVIGPAAADLGGTRPDFVIGSVHYLGRLADGRRWTVDGPREELEQGITETFGGDSRAAVEDYYRLVREMVVTQKPDVVGRMDLIKKNNQGLFDEEAPWYRKAVDETVETLASAEAIVEVNTGGVTRGYRADFYPSEWVVRRMRKCGVRLTLSSDAHKPGDLAAHFAVAASGLRAAGYGSYWRLGHDGWREQALPEEGT